MAQERGWSSLPKDLLRLVLDRLPWSTHPSFAGACRHWRSVVTPFYPTWLTPLLVSAADVGSTNLRFYSPYHHKSFEISNTLAPAAKFCSATGRHLTLMSWSSVLETDLLLATGHIHELPLVNFTKFGFVVYDGSRRMFGVYTIGPPRTALAVRDDDGSWQDWEYPAPLRPGATMFQSSPNCNPVLHDGSLYVLYEDGKLAEYDEHRHNEDGYLEILDKPKGFAGGYRCDFSYLFESDQGELMAVLVGRRGTPVHVVKLNEQEMEWENVESLQGRALFTGTLTTMMRKTKVKWMRDKIFLPRLHDWPDTVHVDIVDRDGELAFVPTSSAPAEAVAANEGAGIWSHELGSTEPTEFWDTQNVDYSIWVDFSTCH